MARFAKVELAKKLAGYSPEERAEIIAYAREMTGNVLRRKPVRKSAGGDGTNGTPPPVEVAQQQDDKPQPTHGSDGKPKANRRKGGKRKPKPQDVQPEPVSPPEPSPEQILADLGVPDAPAGEDDAE